MWRSVRRSPAAFGVAGGVVVALLVLLPALGGARLRALLRGPPEGVEAVHLTVEANQPVEVRIEHHPNHAGEEPVTELGPAPLRRVELEVHRFAVEQPVRAIGGLATEALHRPARIDRLRRVHADEHHGIVGP